MSDAGYGSTSPNNDHNLNGQRLGPKGRQTRDSILAALSDIIETGDVSELSVSGVARVAAVSPANVYNYFVDITDMIIALIDPIMEQAEQSYIHQLRVRWPDDLLDQRCMKFVHDFHVFWKDNASILHLRNAFAEAHDIRMIRHRVDASEPLIRLLVKQMDGDPDDEKSECYGVGVSLLTGIERLVTVATNSQLAYIIPEQSLPDVSGFLRGQARLLKLALRDLRLEQAGKQSGAH